VQSGIEIPQRLALQQGRNEEAKRGTIPWAPNHRGALKSLNNVASTFFNTAHLFPKDFRFEHGGAKLASYPGRHLFSVRPCTTDYSQRVYPVRGKYCQTSSYLVADLW